MPVPPPAISFTDYTTIFGTIASSGSTASCILHSVCFATPAAFLPKVFTLVRFWDLLANAVFIAAAFFIVTGPVWEI